VGFAELRIDTNLPIDGTFIFLLVFIVSTFGAIGDLFLLVTGA
jgi:hypothetical protein